MTIAPVGFSFLVWSVQVCGRGDNLLDDWFFFVYFISKSSKFLDED